MISQLDKMLLPIFLTILEALGDLAFVSGLHFFSLSFLQIMTCHSNMFESIIKWSLFKLSPFQAVLWAEIYRPSGQDIKLYGVFFPNIDWQLKNAKKKL